MAIKYKLNGKEVSEAEFMADAKGIELGETLLPAQGNQGWPILSLSAKVHPSQVKEAIAAAKRRGVPTDYTKDGRPVLRSPRHQTEYLSRVRGMVNMDGGYAETAPTTTVWER